MFPIAFCLLTRIFHQGGLHIGNFVLQTGFLPGFLLIFSAYTLSYPVLHRILGEIFGLTVKMPGGFFLDAVSIGDSNGLPPGFRNENYQCQHVCQINHRCPGYADLVAYEKTRSCQYPGSAQYQIFNASFPEFFLSVHINQHLPRGCSQFNVATETFNPDFSTTIT